jgi:pyruvate kinase
VKRGCRGSSSRAYSSEMRRTKIVATIGPASRDPQVLEQLIRAGVNVCRLNFSHGSHDDHLAVIRAAREIAARLDVPLALLQDLSGPKIRTGRMKGDRPVELKDGGHVRITTDHAVEGTAELISTTYEPLAQDLVPGDKILLDDGNLELRVVKANQLVECQVVHGGLLKSNKGMNLPGAKLSAPALTEKDRQDLAFGVKNGVDYVALSFVRRPEDVREAKALIRSLGGAQPLIAKIEKREAIESLDAVLDATDGVMVARGDLGVEISTESVPTLQKVIIKKANALGKVVITATQMLESMVENPRPTRAEASDVANAILDGTDGVMLSAESAAGAYPVESVETMARIADFTEEHYGFGVPGKMTGTWGSDVARSLARVASTVAEELGGKLIVCFTESGATARVVSAFRPRVPIAAITHDEAVSRQLALWWGVVPLRSQFAATTDEMMVRGEELLVRRGLARSGDRVVMLAGHSHTAGATNMLRVHTLR